jgi:hypothetical protein
MPTHAEHAEPGVPANQQKLTPVLRGLTEYVNRRTRYDSLIPGEFT